jgi:hypothetical protein
VIPALVSSASALGLEFLEARARGEDHPYFARLCRGTHRRQQQVAVLLSGHPSGGFDADGPGWRSLERLDHGPIL